MIVIYVSKFKHFTSKYDSTVIIYACRDFIRLSTGHTGHDESDLTYVKRLNVNYNNNDDNNDNVDDDSDNSDDNNNDVKDDNNNNNNDDAEGEKVSIVIGSIVWGTEPN